MSIFELFLTACGLSMDAFAVSVTNGLCVRKGRVRGALMCGIIFGLFQGIMPAIGYALGMNFAEYIERFDHWIACCGHKLCGTWRGHSQVGGVYMCRYGGRIVLWVYAW